MKNLVALLSGLLFGLGLSLGGMTDPAVVLAFLDLFGAWDPRLAFVMLGAVLTTAIGYRLVLRRPRPLLEDSFQLPKARHFDVRLIAGAALFGIGWGIAGYCPGPALASLSGGATSLLVLVASMVAGWWLAARLPANSR
ncbi:MAG: YeeE/YedE family protein [Gammaproteobacteria bacterium]|nr:YeeE/YedE family protein [Gammaproteobacteria bacterium]